MDKAKKLLIIAGDYQSKVLCEIPLFFHNINFDKIFLHSENNSQNDNYGDMKGKINFIENVSCVLDDADEIWISEESFSPKIKELLAGRAFQIARFDKNASPKSFINTALPSIVIINTGGFSNCFSAEMKLAEVLKQKGLLINQYLSADSYGLLSSLKSLKTDELFYTREDAVINIISVDYNLLDNNSVIDPIQRTLEKLKVLSAIVVTEAELCIDYSKFQMLFSYKYATKLDALIASSYKTIQIWDGKRDYISIKNGQNILFSRENGNVELMTDTQQLYNVIADRIILPETVKRIKVADAPQFGG